MVELSSGVTARGRGQSAPRHFSPGNFYLEKGENGEEGKKNCKRVGGKKLLNEEKSFFFLFSLFTFQNGNFLPGKSISRREKIRRNDLAPSEKKYSSYGSGTKAYNYSKILKTSIIAKHHLSHQGSLVPLNLVSI